ncbi:hypothetical protein BAT02nite_23010 [Bacillus atrophaeus]|nr:hypothetical protein AXI57_09360 [Bacillus atrophaeus]GED02657.1 hypothetical protein BAT02nite_23010 [Bacillus atrophaeus]
MNKAYADIHGLPAGFPSFPGGYQQGYHPCGSRTVHTVVASFNLNSFMAQNAMDSISELWIFGPTAGTDTASRRAWRV